MSRHIPRHERWSKLGPNEYRSAPSRCADERALVGRRGVPQREEPAAGWQEQTERLGPYKRPRNAMIAAEERVLLLGRRYGDNVRFERRTHPAEGT